MSAPSRPTVSGKLGEKHYINGRIVRDPVMRADKRCVVCKKPLPAPPDPFCSAVCCRAYHGTTF